MAYNVVNLYLLTDTLNRDFNIFLGVKFDYNTITYYRNKGNVVIYELCPPPPPPPQKRFPYVITGKSGMQLSNNSVIH